MKRNLDFCSLFKYLFLSQMFSDFALKRVFDILMSSVEIARYIFFLSTCIFLSGGI